MAVPMVRTTFVKPLSENRDFANMQKVAMPSISPHKENKDSYSIYGKQSAAVKALDKSNRMHLSKMDSVHHQVLTNIEEMEKWKSKIEMENKQKNKKIESLMHSIEGQKKTVLDLQLKNEGLNVQLAEEIQQRSFVSEKLHSTKEMCSALKKHFNTLQSHLEYKYKIEEMINTIDCKRSRELENLKNKLDSISIEHSEKVNYLNNALASEASKVMDLRERFGQQLNEFENEKNAMCTMLRNYEIEMGKLSANLEEEKNKYHNLDREKKDLESSIFQLENSKETYATLLSEKEEALKIIEMSKQDVEKKLLLTCTELNELKVKNKEFLDNTELCKDEYEKKYSDMKHIIEISNDKILNLEKRVDEERNKNEELIETFKDLEIEKCAVEMKIAEYESELETFDKLRVSYEEVRESYSSLLKENNEFHVLYEEINRELMACKSEKEQLYLSCEEKSKHLNALQQDYENKLLSEAAKLSSCESNYQLMIDKLKTTEENLMINLDIIKEKDNEISKLQSVIEEKTHSFEVLQYENIGLKDKIEMSKQSVQICLECEQLTEKIGEIETLKASLTTAEKELTTQKDSNWELLKLLQETETSYNKDRLARAEEIESLQLTIGKLKLDINVLKFQLDQCNETKAKNQQLLEVVEKANAETLEHLDQCNETKAKNQQLLEAVEKANAETLEHLSKIKELEEKLATNNENTVQKNPHSNTVAETGKVIDTVTEKTELKGKRRQAAKKNEPKGKSKSEQKFKKPYRSTDTKMEALNNEKKTEDIKIYRSTEAKREALNNEKNTEDIKPLRRTEVKNDGNKKKIELNKNQSEVSTMFTDSEQESSASDNVKVETQDSTISLDSDQESNVSSYIKVEELEQLQQKRPVAKKIKSWDVESSGSECLEIVYDKNSNKPVGVSKVKQSCDEDSSKMEIKPFSFATKRKRENQSISQEDIVRKKFGLPPRNKDNSFFTLRPSLNTNTSTPIRKNEGEAISRSPWLSTPIRKNEFAKVEESEKLRSPWLNTTPNQRKFFKRPLEERENENKSKNCKLWI